MAARGQEGADVEKLGLIIYNLCARYQLSFPSAQLICQAFTTQPTITAKLGERGFGNEWFYWFKMQPGSFALAHKCCCPLANIPSALVSGEQGLVKQWHLQNEARAGKLFPHCLKFVFSPYLPAYQINRFKRSHQCSVCFSLFPTKHVYITADTLKSIRGCFTVYIS